MHEISFYLLNHMNQIALLFFQVSWKWMWGKRKCNMIIYLIPLTKLFCLENTIVLSHLTRTYPVWSDKSFPWSSLFHVSDRIEVLNHLWGNINLNLILLVLGEVCIHYIPFFTFKSSLAKKNRCFEGKLCDREKELNKMRKHFLFKLV